MLNISLVVIRGDGQNLVFCSADVVSQFSKWLSMDQEIYIFLDVEVSSQHPTDRGLSILKEEYILCIKSMQTLPWHCVSSNLTWHLGCMG